MYSKGTVKRSVLEKYRFVDKADARTVLTLPDRRGTKWERVAVGYAEEQQQVHPAS